MSIRSTRSGRSARSSGPLSLPCPLARGHSGVVLIDDGLQVLDEVDAMRLLAQSHLGRVGLTIGALPAIFPVNYCLIDGDIVFRSSPGSKVSAASRGTVVAFEVDDYHDADRSGWSVLVVGRSEVVHDLHVTFKGVGGAPRTYAEGRPRHPRALHPGVAVRPPHRSRFCCRRSRRILIPGATSSQRRLAGSARDAVTRVPW